MGSMGQQQYRSVHMAVSATEMQRSLSIHIPCVDSGASFRAAPRQDRARLAAVLANANKPALLFSGQGPLTSQP